jgi:hypothetical protein
MAVAGPATIRNMCPWSAVVWSTSVRFTRRSARVVRGSVGLSKVCYQVSTTSAENGGAGHRPNGCASSWPHRGIFHRPAAARWWLGGWPGRGVDLRGGQPGRVDVSGGFGVGNS